MTNFTLRFQHPFEEQLREINYVNKSQTIQTFKAIDWRQLTIDVYEKHDVLINDYYFFDVAFSDFSSYKHSLNISGMYTYGETLTKIGPQFQLCFTRPVEKITKGFFGLGAAKTKTVLDTLDIEYCDLPFVIECLDAFLKHDQFFLEQNIINNVRSSF